MAYYDTLPEDIFGETDPKFNKFLIDKNEQDILKEQLRDQYVYLNSLGEDLIDNKPTNDENLIDFILYTNDNYLELLNLDSMLENNRLLQIFGRFIYEFIIINLIKDIIPKISSNNIKENILNIIALRLENLNLLSKQAENIEIKREIIKWSYLLEVIDLNNITKLEENFIMPIRSKYII